MANTTFTGPVRSENGFQDITKDSSTGVVTVNATFAAATVITDLTASGTIILSNLPTSDPSVANQLWSNSLVLTVSAG
tara:strand:+ start:561 stop:794 length:234 start_codon:yes stop_codon:yes gene_type:complete